MAEAAPPHVPRSPAAGSRRWRRLRPRTLRARVTALAAALVAVVLVVVSVGLVLAEQALLTRGLDEVLLQTAETVAAGGTETAAGGAERDAGGAERDSGADQEDEQELDDDEQELDDEVAWQVVDADGAVVGSSPVLRGLGPIAVPESGRRTVAASGPLTRLEGPLRVVTVAVDDRPDAAVVHVVGSLDEMLDAVEVLATSLAVAVPMAVLLLAGVVWIMVGRVLRPVEDIRSEVAAIGGSDLDRRVPEPATGDEVARLAATMNAMLHRLETAVEQQRRFVADASHELRSPLTRIRAQLEVAGPDDDATALRASLLEDAGELSHLVDDLLFLARADDPGVARREDLVDLDEVVLAEVVRARATAAATGRDVVLDASAVSGAEVRGDRAALARAVRNLLDNAVRHARTSVDVVLEEQGGRDGGRGVARLVVADDGPGIPAGDAERVFERFTRLDDARSRDAGGAGLGLAIVREVAARHGGTARVEHAAPGARLVLELPTSG